MPDDDFVEYTRAQAVAISDWRIAECERHGCKHPAECTNTTCYNHRNNAVYRWCKEGRAAAFRAAWYGSAKKDETCEGHNSEKPSTTEL